MSLLDTIRYWQRGLQWKPLNRKASLTGALVKGDADVPPSSDNTLKMLLAWTRWKQVIIGVVDAKDKPFYVGFIDTQGRTFICDSPLIGVGFRAKLGHEDAVFFAIDEKGTELRIEVSVLPKEVAAKYSDMEYPRI